VFVELLFSGIPSVPIQPPTPTPPTGDSSSFVAKLAHSPAVQHKVEELVSKVVKQIAEVIEQ
jgi:hypothetical protein